MVTFCLGARRQPGFAATGRTRPSKPSGRPLWSRPPGTGSAIRGFDCADQRRMQGAQGRNLPMRRCGRHGEPLRRKRQVDDLIEIELGVVAQTGRFICRRVQRPADQELAPNKRARLLTRAVSDPHAEARGVFIEDRQDERRSRFWSRTDAVGEAAPDDFASGRLRPPLDHFVAVGKSAERTERVLRAGARRLICRS